MGEQVTPERLEACPICGSIIQAVVQNAVALRNGHYFLLMAEPYNVDALSFIKCRDNDHTEQEMLDKLNEGR